MTSHRIKPDAYPRTAYTIPGREDQPETWCLPHHRAAVARASNKALVEKSVDWELMQTSVDALGGRRDARILAGPEERLTAANHLAAHYRAAGRPLPDILAARIDI